MSLAEVENETKIRRKYLKALENDDFNLLPGGVYVKGFLRSYARYLNLDGEELVRRYEELLGDRPQAEQLPEVPVDTIIKKPAKSRRGFFVVAAVFIVGMMFYIWGATGNEQRDDPGIGKEQNMLAEEGDGNNAAGSGDKGVGDSKNSTAQKPEQKGLDVVLEVTNGDCWMHVIVDEKDIFQGLVNPGNTKEFHAEKVIWVKLGDAGSVRVKVNGNDYGFLGNKGDVVTKVFRAGENVGNTVDG